MEKHILGRTSGLLRPVMVAFAMLCISSLSGCSASTTELTSDETRTVSRYIADQLLKYDRVYNETKLVYSEPVAPTEAPMPTEIPVTAEPVTTALPDTQAEVPTDESSDSTSEQEQVVEWSEFFATDEWEISYKSFDTFSTYPKNSDVYSITASKGKELLVLFFDVINKTDNKVKVDLTDSDLKYSLRIGEETYKPMLAILNNGGLQYLDIKLAANSKKRAELVFEIPSGIDLSGMRLDVSK